MKQHISYLRNGYILELWHSKSIVSTYPNVCFEGSGKSGGSTDFTPVAMHGLTDWNTILSDILNVVGVEDPSTEC